MPGLMQIPPARSPADALRPPAIPGVTRLIRRSLTLAYRIAGRHQYDDYRLEWLRGIPFLVTPGVFNPRLPRTGAFLAEQLDARLIAGDRKVLDMGTGSGVCAIFAAQHSRRVVAVDVSAAAVRCARINVALNQLEHRVDVRHGDLFAPVAGQRFDLIVFNPPFLRGAPRDDRDRAWRSIDVSERFAGGLRDHLLPGGSALVLLSSFGGAERFLEEFRRQRLAITVHAERASLTERLAVFRIEPMPPCRQLSSPRSVA
jgi:methylase of polypeptide subunit release factors